MVWPVFGDHSLKLEAIKRIMTSKDDVVVAIIGGALLEEAVARTLQERMRDDPKNAKRLFDLDRPLSNVAAQIDALYMLWGLDEASHGTMLGIARVRNFFAHNLNANFESNDKSYKKNIAKLSLHTKFKNYPDARFGTPTDQEIEATTVNRDLFIVNLKLCLNVLMQDRCRHRVHSLEPVDHEELARMLTDSGAI